MHLNSLAYIFSTSCLWFAPFSFSVCFFPLQFCIFFKIFISALVWSQGLLMLFTPTDPLYFSFKLMSCWSLCLWTWLQVHITAVLKCLRLLILQYFTLKLWVHTVVQQWCRSGSDCKYWEHGKYQCDSFWTVRSSTMHSGGAEFLLLPHGALRKSMLPPHGPFIFSAYSVLAVTAAAPLLHNNCTSTALPTSNHTCREWFNFFWEPSKKVASSFPHFVPILKSG